MIFNCLFEVYKDDHLAFSEKTFYSEVEGNVDEKNTLIEKLRNLYKADKIKIYKLSNID